MMSNKRLTWQTPMGTWGVADVNLAALPPPVYAALWKLKNMENLVETINAPDTAGWLAAESVVELLGERKTDA